MECGYVIKFDEGFYETKAQNLFESLYSATIFKSRTKAIKRAEDALLKHNKSGISETEWHNPSVIGVKLTLIEDEIIYVK